MTRRNYDRRTFPGEVTAEQLATLRMPETKMIRRVAGCVYRDKRRITSSHLLAVGQRMPRHTPRDILLRPRHLEKSDVRHTFRNCHRSRCVIDVTVRDQHLGETSSAECMRERIQMRWFTGPCIDQRRHMAWNEPCRVAVAGHRSRVERVNWNRRHDSAVTRLRPTASDRTT